MVSIKVREAIRVVEAAGWVQVSQEGSRRQYKHPARPGKVTIAGKPSATIPPGTWANIRRQAGL